MKKTGKSEEYILNQKNVNAFWGVCKTAKDRFLIGLMLFCGLRVSEAIHLKVTWIRDNKIHIPLTMECHCWGCGNHPKHPGLWKVKSKAGNRVVPIPGFMKPIVSDILRYQPDGLGYNRHYAWQRVQALSKEAKTPRIFPHALRATCATILASKGFTAVELCRFMGWSRLEMGEHYIRIGLADPSIASKIKQLWPDR